MATQTIDFNDVTSVTFDNQDVYEVYLNNTKMWNATPLGYYLAIKGTDNVLYYMNKGDNHNVVSSTTPSTVWTIDFNSGIISNDGDYLYVYHTASATIYVGEYYEPQYNPTYFVNYGVYNTRYNQFFFTIKLNSSHNFVGERGSNINLPTSNSPYNFQIIPVYA